MKYNIIAESEEETVVTEYKPVKEKSALYQSEAELEAEFIRLLQEQGYEYLSIHSEADLVLNLRKQLEAVNDCRFSDNEWKTLFSTIISNPNNGIVEKTRLIQDDYRQAVTRDDGTVKNISLIDKSNIHNNRLQVINQYEAEGGKHKNRYDVTILVNGLPLVHIELKRRGVAIREAFNQIERYQRESFWSESGLFEFVQIFVISNGTNTKYYSNTTRFNHIRDTREKRRKTKTSNSFEFTSFWADSKNRVIPDLIDFTKTFFARHTILSILARYCVFTSEQMLLVMRPYQIAATEKILNKIEISTNYKKYGTVDGGGYIWHTTGSGKTLSSFKASRLASELPYIDKVLFVVDRKDLDYQTMREYDRFEKGCANSNRNTAILRKQLEDDRCRIIITTIQKLSVFIKSNPNAEIYGRHVVLIFDECHRSQFGDMHREITRSFKKYHLFGFTGTPIFSVNAGSSGCADLRTTAQAFGERLHSYTIVNAINDHNVLPFRVDYIRTIGSAKDFADEEVYDIDRESVYADQRRIGEVVRYILEHFNQKTYRNQKSFKHNVVTNVASVATAKDRLSATEEKATQYVSGFNSIFAVSSIPVARKYYDEFMRQMREHPESALKVGLIYSYGANAEEADGIIDEEVPDDTEGMDRSDRDFLESAIADYNVMFGTSYDTSADKFPNYYKDVSLRMKNKELDLLIVVNMFLTGFDATTLNTLWVDKNLRMHGLLQAFSRTNRIYNSVKTFGNIVCFRNLQKNTDESIALFGDEDASGIVLLRSFRDYYDGYTDSSGRKVKGYSELIGELFGLYPIGEAIEGEKRQKSFVKLFSAILRLRNLLSSFDEFSGCEIISDRDFQDYCGRYLDMKDDFRHRVESENVNDDIVFEIELLKQVEIDIDYILALIAKYHESHCTDKEVYVSIQKAVDSSPKLRSKKELIESFIKGVNEMDDVVSSWHEFVAENRRVELERIIKEENLNPEGTEKFMKDCFLNGSVKTTGTAINDIMPPVSRFARGQRAEKKRRIIDKFVAFFEKFFGVV